MHYWKTVKKNFSEPVLGASLFFLLTFLFSATGFSRELTDVTGTRVRLNDHPKRIVALAPSLAELVADLSEGDASRLVGVSDFSDYPPAVKNIPSVGQYARFNIEKVLSLKPDLVLATTDGNPRDQVLHLREMGLPVVVVATESLGKISESIKLAALAMGESDKGQKMAAQLQKGIENFRTKAKSRPSVRVLLEVGDQPLIVAGKNSFLNEALETIGAKNVYESLDTRYPRPAVEDVVRRNPDVIIVFAMGSDLQLYEKMAARWSQYPSLGAVKGRRIRILVGDSVLRPTLRLLEGLSLLERAVYGQ